MKAKLKALKMIWNQIAKDDELYYQSAQEPQGSVCSLNHYYHEDHDPMHLCDIARPENHVGKLPVILHIHGGGWVYGHKDSYYKYYAMELSKYGYAVVTMNYRLAFDHPFPSMIEDIFSALKWIEDNQENEQFDISRIFLVGDSAGAHLAALASIIHKKYDLQTMYNLKKTNCTILALGLSCGVYDFDRLLSDDHKMPLRDVLMTTIFNRLDFQSHPLYKVSSVSYLVDNSFTPSYILSSEADTLCPETLKLIEECKEHKVTFVSHVYPESHQLPHVFNLKSIYLESKVVMDEMFEFFKRF
jgi:acetyl esterase/lipase